MEAARGPLWLMHEKGQKIVGPKILGIGLWHSDFFFKRAQGAAGGQEIFLARVSLPVRAAAGWTSWLAFRLRSCASPLTLYTFAVPPGSKGFRAAPLAYLTACPLLECTSICVATQVPGAWGIFVQNPGFCTKNPVSEKKRSEKSQKPGKPG